MKNLFTSFFCFILFCGASAQHHSNIYPGLTGESLIIELLKGYKTNTVLDYSIARDTLFSKIDAVNDSLECIYTGMKLYVTPGQDPTEAVYLNGISNGINTEHSWPQAKGAVGIAQSDMHHLYPTRIKANSDRGNNPFGEINDNLTKTWYYKNLESNTKPTSNIDAYSESINTKFEPKEDSKGNIARSLFYFYTMYKSQADAADPVFFDQMKTDLCNWHYNDPVDDIEWNRTQKIAKYQDGKVNPFVIDCSLVSRAYCNNIDQTCESIVLSSIIDISENLKNATIFPNPGNGGLTLHFGNLISQNTIVTIFDMYGNIRDQISMTNAKSETSIYLDLSYLNDGMFLITIKDTSSQINKVIPYILIK